MKNNSRHWQITPLGGNIVNWILLPVETHWSIVTTILCLFLHLPVKCWCPLGHTLTSHLYACGLLTCISCQNVPWAVCILTCGTTKHLRSASNLEFMKLNTSFLISTSFDLNILIFSVWNNCPISKAEMWVSSLTPPSPNYHISNNKISQPYFLGGGVCFKIWSSPIYSSQYSENVFSKTKTDLGVSQLKIPMVS